MAKTIPLDYDQTVDYPEGFNLRTRADIGDVAVWFTYNLARADGGVLDIPRGDWLATFFEAKQAELVALGDELAPLIVKAPGPEDTVCQVREVRDDMAITGQWKLTNPKKASITPKYSVVAYNRITEVLVGILEQYTALETEDMLVRQ